MFFEVNFSRHRNPITSGKDPQHSYLPVEFRTRASVSSLSPPPPIRFCLNLDPIFAGGDGIENVSVVKSELMAGFSLRKTLGEPKEAAEKLLSTVIAPPDSGTYHTFFHGSFTLPCRSTKEAPSILFWTIVAPPAYLPA